MTNRVGKRPKNYAERRRIHEEVMFSDPIVATVYCCYDSEGGLLYASLADPPSFSRNRISECHREAPWWPLVDPKHTMITSYSDIAQAQRGLARVLQERRSSHSRSVAVERPCALYRHYDVEGTLLYIGITYQQSQRDTHHRMTSAWVMFAERSESQWFRTRADAADAEVAAIQEEVPIFNRGHAPAGRDDRVLDYLQAAGRMDLAFDLL